MSERLLRSIVAPPACPKRDFGTRSSSRVTGCRCGMPPSSMNQVPVRDFLRKWDRSHTTFHLLKHLEQCVQEFLVVQGEPAHRACHLNHQPQCRAIFPPSDSSFHERLRKYAPGWRMHRTLLRNLGVSPKDVPKYEEARTRRKERWTISQRLEPSRLALRAVRPAVAPNHTPYPNGALERYPCDPQKRRSRIDEQRAMRGLRNSVGSSQRF